MGDISKKDFQNQLNDLLEEAIVETRIAEQFVAELEIVDGVDNSQILASHTQ